MINATDWNIVYVKNITPLPSRQVPLAQPSPSSPTLSEHHTGAILLIAQHNIYLELHPGETEPPPGHTPSPPGTRAAGPLLARILQNI